VRTDPYPHEGASFEFVSRVPSDRLARFVTSVWYAKGTVAYKREKIAPTGSTVAVIVLGDPIIQTPRNGAGERFLADRGFLAGPHQGPVINEPTGETYAVGIVTTPVGCEAVFGRRPQPLRGRVVDLEAAWSPAGPLRAELQQLVDPQDLLDAVLRHLHLHANAAVRGVDRCERAIALLEADPTRPIGAIADELGVSHGHLDADFTRVVGLGPRGLARLLRLRSLLANLDVSAEVRWIDHAHRLGWSDQSHFNRDFKRHTGVTPSQYVAAQRTAFGPGELWHAAGFAPER